LISLILRLKVWKKLLFKPTWMSSFLCFAICSRWKSWITEFKCWIFSTGIFRTRWDKGASYEQLESIYQIFNVLLNKSIERLFEILKLEFFCQLKTKLTSKTCDKFWNRLQHRHPLFIIKTNCWSKESFDISANKPWDLFQIQVQFYYSQG